MTYSEANSAIQAVSKSNKPWRPNPSMTIAQAVDVVQAAIQEGIGIGKADQPVFEWLEKRVWQVVKNQKRPKFA